MKHGYAFLLVALGFASGTLSTGIYLRAHPERRASDIPSRSEQVDALADEVGLDADQRRRAHEISDRSHDELVKVQASVEPALAAIRSDVRSRMRAIMSPEQASRFDRYCERRDSQRAHSND